MINKYLFSLFIFIFPAAAFSQITKTAAIPYTTGTPTHTPSASGSAWAIDNSTLDLWVYYGGAWNLAGERIQTISGCAAPAYTPGTGQSLFVVNGCDSLYYYRSGAWRHANKYTAPDGNGIYTGDGTIPNGTNATLAANGLFEIDYAGGNAAVTVDDLNGRVFLQNKANTSFVSLFSNDVRLEAPGRFVFSNPTGATSLRIMEPSGDTNFTEFQSGAQTSDFVYTLPTALATTRQVLQFQSGTQLRWAAVDTLQNNEGILGVGAGVGNAANITTNTSGGSDVIISGGGIIAVTETTGANGGTITLTATEVDGSISNEGSLTVATGGGNDSQITSNTSGSSAVTISGGSGVTVTETGNTITIAATGGGTGTVTTSGSPLTDRLAKFTGSTVIGNSLISESGQIATVNATGALIVPVGNNTTELPSPASNGMVRYDTDNNALEYYNAGATAWEVPLKGSTATGLETAGRVLISNSGGRAASNSALRYNESNRQLILSNNTSYSPATNFKFIVMEDGAGIDAGLLAYTGASGSGTAPAFQFQRARGSFATPQAVQTNDRLGSFLFGGSDGANIQNSVLFAAICDGTPSAGSVPARFSIAVGTAAGDRPERLVVKSSGNIGIGLTEPTAALHLKAGTATANSAPLKFTSGTLNTTAEAGAMEYDGTNFYLTNGSGTRNVIGTSGGNFTAQVTEYTTAQTNTTLAIPSGATMVEIVCIGSGSGGGSGRRGATTTARTGGGGGASGNFSIVTIRVSDITSTPLLVTVGAGGAGGAAVTADNTDGNAGGGGNASQVTANNGTILCFANGASSGGGGGREATAATAGTTRVGGDLTGAAGVTSSVNGGSGSNGTTSNIKTPSGGASGAGLSTSNSATTGGNGGTWSFGMVTQSNQGTTGTPNAGNGGTPAQGQIVGGGGGGGGGSQAAAAGGNGGNGVRGGGGGGGAASSNGFNSGAGGAGGAGYVRVTFY